MSGPELRKPVRQTIREIAMHDTRVRHVPPIPQDIYTAATGSVSYPDVATFVRVMARRSFDVQVAWMRLAVKHNHHVIHTKAFCEWCKAHAGKLYAMEQAEHDARRKAINQYQYQYQYGTQAPKAKQ
jgi:hypothetical protein